MSTHHNEQPLVHGLGHDVFGTWDEHVAGMKFHIEQIQSLSMQLADNVGKLIAKIGTKDLWILVVIGIEIVMVNKHDEHAELKDTVSRVVVSTLVILSGAML